MNKVVFILTIAGALLGFFNNLMFYIFGSAAEIIFSSIVKGFIPVLDLSEADAALQNLIYLNAIAASVLCLIAMVAGFFYYRGDRSKEIKGTGKYISTVILIAVTAGLAITLSYISVILIGIAALISLISAIYDFVKGMTPPIDNLRTSIIIAVLLSGAALVLLYCVPLMIN